MIKVDFFCIGAQKAGTTLLHDILIQHPEIYLPQEKEAHFFDVNELYEKGLGYYSGLFSTHSKEKIVGNINPNLQIENRSIERIIDCYGRDIKIIFLLRNPVKRAYSHYLMSVKRGYETLDFISAIESERLRIQHPKAHKGYYSSEPGHFEKNHLGYLQRGLYAPKVKYLMDRLPNENLKIVLFEEFVEDKDKVLLEILNFLEVDPTISLDTDLKSNPAQKAKSRKLSRMINSHSKLKEIMKLVVPRKFLKSMKNFVSEKNLSTLDEKDKKLSQNEYDLVMGYFKKDIAELEKLLGKSLNVWQ